ncbi:MAG TPA: glucans biosynthesis glucosyltransferase MdoH [Lacunisphaera sp.]|jgi:membrane glycosyltransferase|nr:glucans biosynthesis glucosyltransferase MdoH [Lacunisphaera sp.]
MPAAVQSWPPDAARMTRRRVGVLTFVLFVTALASLLMADLLWGTPFASWGIAIWGVFTLLFGLVAFGAAHAFFGFMVRHQGGYTGLISATLPPALEGSVPLAPTAIVMPVHNEPPDRIFAGLQAIYHSVERTGQLDHFRFFILSDSTSADHWVEEEIGWARLVARLGAAGRIFYRRRRINSHKKAGNIADFCRRWGRRFRYMVVLDADSVMSGETIVRLVRLMERNPTAGLIQTAPVLIRAQTLFARTLQFAFRLYGPVFQAGLNYWQLGEGNYWGHNAIIRLQPFMRHCSLPRLPGREPFGGHILSHDFVEAALLRRAGWAVWLAPDLPGTYEEPPPSLIDFARRDRRWSQGNLQHFWLLFARGLPGLSRVHLFLGIFAYCSSLLWLSSLMLGTLLAIGFARTGLTWLPEPALANLVGVPVWWQSVALTITTFVLLFAPKVLACIDRALQPGGLGAFGGAGRVAAGMLIESAFSVLLAPVLMLFHAKFVLATLFGRGVRWVAQRREGHISWREAAVTHAGHTAFGLAWTLVLAYFAPKTLWWTSPVLAGLLLSIPFSQLTARQSPGGAGERGGVLSTPEELAPPRELQELSQLLAEPPADCFLAAAGEGVLRVVVDPCANALHCALQRERPRLPPAARRRLDGLVARLLASGPAALTEAEKNSVLFDPLASAQLHRAVWTQPPSTLAPAWREALARCRAAPEAAPTASAPPLAEPVVGDRFQFAPPAGGLDPAA